ncbi:SMC-Scp complex subunit ScpB [Chitinophagales bacterium]|nr:SMC-Scp complex subunit ScpB [Chitinophagales bacterium]
MSDELNELEEGPLPQPEVVPAEPIPETAISAEGFDLKEIQSSIEAMCFVAENAVRIADIQSTLESAMEIEVSKATILSSLDALEQKYEQGDYPFQLVQISDGYRFLTKPAYHRLVSSYLNIKSRRRLSNAAMETLSIIAYRQPVTKGQIEDIRGVSCDYSIQKLLEKDLIEITGRAEAVGRPLLYGTSKYFMDHFGLKSLKDLPILKEVVPQENVIGEAEMEIVEPNEALGAKANNETDTEPDNLTEATGLTGDQEAETEEEQNEEMGLSTNDNAELDPNNSEEKFEQEQAGIYSGQEPEAGSEEESAERRETVSFEPPEEGSSDDGGETVSFEGAEEGSSDDGGETVSFEGSEEGQSEYDGETVSFEGSEEESGDDWGETVSSESSEEGRDFDNKENLSIEGPEEEAGEDGGETD